MKWILLSALAIGAIWFPLLGCTEGQTAPSDHPAHAKEKELPEGAKFIVVGGGCFWCVEAIFEDLKGVYFVESGYAGGDKPGVTYKEVCTGTTGHAEVVKIVYDPKKVHVEDLLRIFFTTHDPTTLNRQGNDVGTQYRSVLFYIGETEKNLMTKIRDEVEKEKIWPRPIVTSIEELKHYTVAEDYHQNYFEKYEKASEAERMTMNAGYCNAIIAPKVKKFREKYAAKLKKP